MPLVDSDWFDISLRLFWSEAVNGDVRLQLATEKVFASFAGVDSALCAHLTSPDDTESLSTVAPDRNLHSWQGKRIQVIRGWLDKVRKEPDRYD